MSSSSLSTIALGVLVGGSILFVILLITFIMCILWERDKCCFAKKTKPQPQVNRFNVGAHPVSLAGFDEAWTEPGGSVYRTGGPGQGRSDTDNSSSVTTRTPKSHSNAHRTASEILGSPDTLAKQGRAQNGARRDDSGPYSMASSFGTPTTRRRQIEQLEETEQKDDIEDQTPNFYFELDRSDASFRGQSTESQSQSSEVPPSHAPTMNESDHNDVYSVAEDEGCGDYTELQDESTSERNKDLSTAENHQLQLGHVKTDGSGDYFVLEESDTLESFGNNRSSATKRVATTLKQKRESGSDGDYFELESRPTSEAADFSPITTEDTADYFVLEERPTSEEIYSRADATGSLGGFASEAENSPEEVGADYFVLENEQSRQANDSFVPVGISGGDETASPGVMAEDSGSEGTYFPSEDGNREANSAEVSIKSDSMVNDQAHTYYAFDPEDGKVLEKDFSLAEVPGGQQIGYSTLEKNASL